MFQCRRSHPHLQNQRFTDVALRGFSERRDDFLFARHSGTISELRVAAASFLSPLGTGALARQTRKKEELGNGPKSQLVAGGGGENVVISYEGSSDYDDTRLLKVGEHGFLHQIPQNHVICFHKAFRGSVDHSSLFPVRREIERRNHSRLFRKRPRDLTTFRVDYRDRLVGTTGENDLPSGEKTTAKGSNRNSVGGPRRPPVSA
jgi:hypothetical protein